MILASKLEITLLLYFTVFSKILGLQNIQARNSLNFDYVMLVILYLMFSRPRADDEERDAEESSKKGGRLVQLLPLHQELLLFVIFVFHKSQAILSLVSFHSASRLNIKLSTCMLTQHCIFKPVTNQPHPLLTLIFLILLTLFSSHHVGAIN